MIERVDNRFGLFDYVFSGLRNRGLDLVKAAKLFVYNHLSQKVSVNRVLDVYPEELFTRMLLFRKLPELRALYRAIKTIGINFEVVERLLQSFLMKHNLVDEKQFMDFSSIFFEGKACPLGELGYSRDHRPGKKQVTVGVSVGENNLPVAVTIQKGNVQDKEHMVTLINTAACVFKPGTILIFDAGGNTRDNKNRIRKKGLHYLTRTTKNCRTHKKYVREFKPQETITVNGTEYQCMKLQKKNSGSYAYVYYSETRKAEQLLKKQKTFKKAKEKGNKLLNKHKPDRLPSDQGWVTLTPSLQTTLSELDNPYVNGLEGYFVLESSLDKPSEEILRLFKERDKAEKFMRLMKEGLETRPLRHWDSDMIKGAIVLMHVASLTYNLTLKTAENPEVKNCKLLKKYLNNMTLTYVYPVNNLVKLVVSNIKDIHKQLFGTSLYGYVRLMDSNFTY